MFAHKNNTIHFISLKSMFQYALFREVSEFSDEENRYKKKSNALKKIWSNKLIFFNPALD